MTSWAEAYRASLGPANHSYSVECLYEDVSAGIGDTLQDAKDDFLENIRGRITELSEMLEFCAKNEPRQVCQKL